MSLHKQGFMMQSDDENHLIIKKFLSDFSYNSMYSPLRAVDECGKIAICLKDVTYPFFV